MKSRSGGGIAAALAVFSLAGCSGVQSALDPGGPAARELASMFWTFTSICTAIWLLVMIVLAFTLAAERRPRPDPMSVEPTAELERRRLVTLAAAASAVVLVALTLLSFFADRTLARIGRNADLIIRVTGHQWWWEVRYEIGERGRVMTTANEIRLPTGEPVRVLLQSVDVIHSFWVPALHGKLDLIPGLTNSVTIRADKPGIYRGQCAEFCGLQHAHMSILIIAEPRAAFAAWYRDQLEQAVDAPGANRNLARGSGEAVRNGDRATTEMMGGQADATAVRGDRRP